MIETTLQLCACAILGAFTVLTLMVIYLALCVVCKHIAQWLER
jgi:hypothetical protein